MNNNDGYVEKVNIDKMSPSDKKIEVNQAALLEYENISNEIVEQVVKITGVKKTDDTNTLIVNYYGDFKDETVERLRGRLNIFDLIKDYAKYNGQALLIGIASIIVILLNLNSIINMFMAIGTLNLRYAYYNNIPLELITLFAPMMLWFLSTDHAVYNYRKFKRFTFVLAYLFFNIQIVRASFIAGYLVFVPLITKIPLSEAMPLNKLVSLAYIAIVATMSIPVLLLFYIMKESTLMEKDFMDVVTGYRLFKVLDLTRYKKSEYTDKTVKNLETGKSIVISEKSRGMHKSVIGATGTAKTTSVLLKGIYDDLMTRLYNKGKLAKHFKWMIKKGMIIQLEKFELADFHPSFFDVNPDYKSNIVRKLFGRTPSKLIEKYTSKYSIAGQTILAPEDSLTDDAYNLFKAYGENVNRLDPKLVDGKHKADFKGLNILFISPLVPDYAVDRERVRRSTLLSDVMQIMFEMGGKSDPYFASVNRIATTTISYLLQITFPILKNRQPNMVDVRDHLDDFDLLMEHYNCLFGTKELIEENERYRWLRKNIENYFIGEAAATFEQHCRGLKVQFSSFLADEYIRNVVSAEDILDQDQMLSKAQLTVVNIELPELGPINSPALGLFFNVTYRDAILRRPGTEFTRGFHCFRMDEFPIVATESIEHAFTLFRKFRVSVEVAMQTLEQLDERLRSVVINSTATQVIFGRSNLMEMETFSKLGGTVKDYVTMKGVTETPLFSEKPTISTQTRETTSIANNLEESDVRNKDFQEITLFYTKRGAAMSPINGTVSFLSTIKRKGLRNVKRFNWNNYFKDSEKEEIESEFKSKVNSPANDIHIDVKSIVSYENAKKGDMSKLIDNDVNVESEVSYQHEVNINENDTSLKLNKKSIVKEVKESGVNSYVDYSEKSKITPPGGPKIKKAVTETKKEGFVDNLSLDFDDIDVEENKKEEEIKTSLEAKKAKDKIKYRNDDLL